MTLQGVHTQLGADAERFSPRHGRRQGQGDLALAVLVAMAWLGAPLNVLSQIEQSGIFDHLPSGLLDGFTTPLAVWRFFIAPLGILLGENPYAHTPSLGVHILASAALSLPALIRFTATFASLDPLKKTLRSALADALTEAVPQKYKDRIGFNPSPRAIIDDLFSGAGPTISRIKTVEKRFDRTKQKSRYYRNYGAPTRSPRTMRALAACRALRNELAIIQSAVWSLLFIAALSATGLLLFSVNALLLHWIPSALQVHAI